VTWFCTGWQNRTEPAEDGIVSTHVKGYRKPLHDQRLYHLAVGQSGRQNNNISSFFSCRFSVTALFPFQAISCLPAHRLFHTFASCPQSAARNFRRAVSCPKCILFTSIYVSVLRFRLYSTHLKLSLCLECDGRVPFLTSCQYVIWQVTFPNWRAVAPVLGRHW